MATDKCPVCGAMPFVRVFSDDPDQDYWCGRGKVGGCRNAETMLADTLDLLALRDAEIARQKEALAKAEADRDEACGFMTLQAMETGKLRMALAGLAGLDPLDPANTTDAFVKRIEQRERDVRHAAEDAAIKAVERGAERIASEVEPRIRQAADEREQAINAHRDAEERLSMLYDALGLMDGKRAAIPARDKIRSLLAFLMSAEPLIGDYLCDRARTHGRFNACRAALEIARALGQETP